MNGPESARWPVEIQEREFHPIPESWIAAGNDHGTPGKRVYAVSATVVCDGTWFSLRYAHPASGEVLRAKTGAVENESGDGLIPAGLAKGTGWPRYKTPHPCVEPVEPLRDPEWEHFRELWQGRLDLGDRTERSRPTEVTSDPAPPCRRRHRRDLLAGHPGSRS